MNLLSIFLQAESSGSSSLLLFGGMAVIFLLTMILPQWRRSKQEKKFQEAIKKGDWIVTTSGIHGKIFDMNDDTVTIETGAGKIKFEKSAISVETTNTRYGKSKDEAKK